jgi:hypothetical protein
MITKYLEVGNNKWGILISYDFDYLDYDDIASLLEAFGVSDKSVRKSLTILSEPNTGMAVSNSDIRMTAIYIGYTTKPSEFWNTLNHELYHATTAIIDYYGEPYNEEPAAYLHGELMRLAVESIGEPCY